MAKEEKLNFHIISNSENHLINQVAAWYDDEWGIPKVKTSEAINNLDNERYFHAIMSINGEPVAAGGIYPKVSIFSIDPSLTVYHNWLALLFVRPQFRGKGIGLALCAYLEQQASQRKIEKLHLFTHTAEFFYRIQNWELLKRIRYQDRNIAVMEKTLEV